VALPLHDGISVGQKCTGLCWPLLITSQLNKVIIFPLKIPMRDANELKKEFSLRWQNLLTEIPFSSQMKCVA
jgi:hypothetical protein